MKKRLVTLSIIAFSAIMLTSCKSDDDGRGEVTETEVTESYADMVLQNYIDARDDAQKMKEAIEAFVKNPSQKTQDAAKEAWKVARESYGPSEAYRFAGGPIDDEDGPEGLLNSWPLDENYIDYVVNPSNKGEILNVGIINDTTDYPEITKDLLVSLNQPVGTDGKTSEENVSTGYHAIEFLLWGQDVTEPIENKPGLRSYTDYIVGKAKNVERRKKYLVIAADLIIDDLNSLISEWQRGGAYRKVFLEMDPKDALTHALTGAATLAKAELAGERMYTALQSKDQEDEHSCFSDNTHVDIRRNFDGIMNVYKASYGGENKPSIEDLVRQKDPEAAAKMQAYFDDAKAKVYATGIPFDIAISHGVESEEGQKIKDAVNALRTLGDQLVLVGNVIGLHLDPKLPAE